MILRTALIALPAILWALFYAVIIFDVHIA